MKHARTTLSFIFFFILGFQLSTSAQVTVHGKITDEKGGPLPSITAVEKGTKTGAVADDAGNYTISVSNSNSILLFTGIGFITQEIPLSQRTEVNVVMKEDVQQMSEVVVMGYSEKKKTEIASAVSVLDAEQLNDVTANNIGTKLQGKVPGLQVINSSGVPGSEPELRIRGVASLIWLLPSGPTPQPECVPTAT